MSVAPAIPELYVVFEMSDYGCLWHLRYENFRQSADWRYKSANVRNMAVIINTIVDRRSSCCQPVTDR